MCTARHIMYRPLVYVAFLLVLVTSCLAFSEVSRIILLRADAVLAVYSLFITLIMPRPMVGGMMMRV